MQQACWSAKSAKFTIVSITLLIGLNNVKLFLFILGNIGQKCLMLFAWLENQVSFKLMFFLVIPTVDNF